MSHLISFGYTKGEHFFDFKEKLKLLTQIYLFRVALPSTIYELPLSFSHVPAQVEIDALEDGVYFPIDTCGVM